jgi:hypothetical protein
VLIFYLLNAKIFGKLKVGVWSCGEEISVWITLIQVVKIGEERKSFLNGLLIDNTILYSPSDYGKETFG